LSNSGRSSVNRATCRPALAVRPGLAVVPHIHHRDGTFEHAAEVEDE
jgi:hypothetical protein